MIALRLPPEIEERLEVLAKRAGCSAAEYASDAIVEYLEDIEIADRRLAALRRGETDTVPLSDLIAHNG